MYYDNVMKYDLWTIIMDMVLIIIGCDSYFYRYVINILFHKAQ